MPPALSPSGRARSRTSDISDFLRGRHDHKNSVDFQPPPMPRLPVPDPVTPPKAKSKFAFLGRKRKPSFSPSSAKTEAAAATVAASASATGGSHKEYESKAAPLPPVPGSSSGFDRDGNQPGPGGPNGYSSPNRPVPTYPPPPPPSGIPLPQSSHSRPNAASPNSYNTQQHAPPPSLINNLRKQKSSFESARRSTDNRVSVRPIITVSPPHNNIQEGADAYATPRSAPQPSGQPSPLRSEAALPTPTASDRTTTPDSPTSADIPSPSASTHSITHLPPSPTDGPTPVATSYKEESLLRKDHFDIGTSDMQPRRGTVSSAMNQPAPATIGHNFAPTRQDRRHASVVQLSKLKKEIIATAPKIRKVPSDSTTLGSQSQSPLGRSNTISTGPPQSPNNTQTQDGPQTPQGRRIPPPLKRTWHTPPTTGPPKEPLPSPPASAARLPQTPITTDSFRTAPPSPAPVSPLSARRTLPPLVPPKDLPALSNTQEVKSPADSFSSANLSVPPSPARSSGEPISDTDPQPSPRTPVREDIAHKVLADENATSQQLREALQAQMEKYKRLSSYLLTLTERHAMEKAELIRKIETLEQDKARREREMKGLKWLVAHSSSRSSSPGRDGPVRADSNTLPRSSSPRTPSSSAAKAKAPRNRSSSAATPRSGRTVASVASITSLASEARASVDSPAGSVEEGLVELQTSISEFIAPLSVSVSEQPQLSTGESASASPPVAGGVRNRLRRANTVPNELSGIPQIAPLQVSPPPKAAAPLSASAVGPVSASANFLKQMQMQSQKMARRTSSPVLPSSLTSSPSPLGLGSAKRQSGIPGATRAGLGLGVGIDSSPAPSASSFSRSPSPSADGRASDTHARSDSSTLSSIPSLPSLSTLHSSSSAASGLSSIPETPRTDLGALDELPPVEEGKGLGAESEKARKRMSTSSVSSSSGSARSGASPSIGQVLDRTRTKSTPGGGRGFRLPQLQLQGQQQHRQPEMDAIMRKLRAFGHGHSSS